MQKAPQQTSEKVENVTVFQICLLVLSLTMVVALLIDTFAPVPPDISKVLQGADFVVCMLLLIDFVVRLKKAENKKEFMRLGWIDLIASIPNVDLLRVGRLVRILRIIRLIRGLRAGHRAVELFLQHRPRNVLASVLTTTILLITFSSIAILIAETSPESNIKSSEDAVWWSITTMTTVGYGDRFPVTTEGRIVAMVLMMAGVGLFGTLSGIIASLFIGNRNEEANENQEMLTRLGQIEEKLTVLTQRKDP